jgi:hypothetical protein
MRICWTGAADFSGVCVVCIWECMCSMLSGSRQRWFLFWFSNWGLLESFAFGGRIGWAGLRASRRDGGDCVAVLVLVFFLILL